MLAKINTLTRKYNAEIAAISTDLKEEIQKKLKREVGERYSTEIGPVREALKVEAENLHTELEAAQDPIRQLARLAVQHHDTVTPGILAIINALPGLPPNMLETLADQAKNPGLQLALYGQVAMKDGDEAAALRAKVLSKVAVNRETIQNLAIAERKRWMALAVACDCPGDHSHAKLDYGHQISALDKILGE